MKEFVTAFMLKSLPCNPIPFANTLVEGVKSNGTSWIATDEAKAILHLLNQMAYGQCYEINSLDEFQRLKEVFDR